MPRPVEGVKQRERAVSFGDHYSQATLFWGSMAPPEQDHIVGAFSFELGKVSDDAIQDRQLANLANVLDPAVIVIGGGLVGAADLLLPEVRRHFADLVMAGDRRPPVPIVPAELGERAGAIGAARNSLSP